MPYHTPETLPPTFICRRLRIPNDIGFITAVNGALLELCQVYNWEQFGAVTPEAARAAMLDMLLDTIDSACDEGIPESGEKLVFTPDASLISYAPQDPYAAADVVPPGYVFPPLYQVGEGVVPFPGVVTGDVLTDLTKLPTAWPPLLPPDGYPRFRVQFHVTGPGPGEVELHLVKLPTAGLALVTLDGNPATADFIDLSTADLLDLTDLGALLGTVLDGDLVRTHIQEYQVADVGDHFIDVTFLPKITTDALLGFGGGVRQVVLGGTAEAGTMPAPQFQLNGDHLEWRPTSDHVWIDLGEVGGVAGPGILATELIPLDHDDPPQLTFDAETKTLTLQLPVGFPPDEPGISATVLNEVAYDAPPSLNFNALTKTLTLDLPVGFPPDELDIQSTEVIPTVGDTPTSLIYNPVNRRLTLNLQALWLRGLRVNPANTAQLQFNTYQAPATWTTWGTVQGLQGPQGIQGEQGPQGAPGGFLDDPAIEFTDEEIACGMATNIMLSMQALWDQSLDELDLHGNVTEAVGEVIEWFYAGGIPVIFQSAVDGITSAYTIGTAAMRASFTPANYDAMQEKLYCLLVASGSYDYAVIALWAQWCSVEFPVLSNPGAWWFYTMTTWLDPAFIKRKAFIGSVDPLATCALYDCPEEAWCYVKTIDMIDHYLPSGFRGMHNGLPLLSDPVLVTLDEINGNPPPAVRMPAGVGGYSLIVYYLDTPQYVSNFQWHRRVVNAGSPRATYGYIDINDVAHTTTSGFLGAGWRNFSYSPNAICKAIIMGANHNASEYLVVDNIRITMNGTGLNPFGADNC